jgi:uncharacterized protein (DUF4415 family)
MKKQLKKKVGRPPVKNPKMRKAVCISQEVYEWYFKKGNGNFSKGIDFVAKRFMNQW